MQYQEYNRFFYFTKIGSYAHPYRLLRCLTAGVSHKWSGRMQLKSKKAKSEKYSLTSQNSVGMHALLTRIKVLQSLMTSLLRLFFLIPVSNSSRVQPGAETGVTIILPFTALISTEKSFSNWAPTIKALVSARQGCCPFLNFCEHQVISRLFLRQKYIVLLNPASTFCHGGGCTNIKWFICDWSKTVLC